MNAQAPIRVDLVTREIAQVADQLLALCGGDDRLYADMLEGETDIGAACSKLLEMIETEEGVSASLIKQIETRNHRLDRSKGRIVVMKAAVQKIMNAGMITTLRLPEATVSLSDLAPRLKVVEDKAVPDQFCTTKLAPSMAKIKETYNVDGALPNWLTVEPARQSLSIRRG